MFELRSSLTFRLTLIRKIHILYSYFLEKINDRLPVGFRKDVLADLHSSGKHIFAKADGQVVTLGRDENTRDVRYDTTYL